MSEGLFIKGGVIIPEAELTLRACRASGPGGQHVNKSNTKIQLMWSPSKSSGLNDQEKKLVCERLHRRINREGVLTCTSDKYRSQARNIEDAREILRQLLIPALHVNKKRKATKPSQKQKARRLKAKRQRSEIKSQRSKKDWD